MSLCMAAVTSAAEKGTRALMGLQGAEWGKGPDRSITCT